jgi:hypothetical protein
MYAISMRTTIIALLAIVAVAGLAQNPADDPGGWTKAKWGMTEDQIKAAFPDAAQIPSVNPRLVLPAYNINPDRFEVVFWFDASGALQEVALSDKFSVEGLKRLHDDQLTAAQRVSAIPGVARGVENVKDDLLISLTAKYGKFADHATTEKGTQDEWLWLFPTTTIKLTWRHAGDSIDGTHLLYSLRKKSSDL